ncbi:MAG: DNA replication initiation control protein YabA [Leptolyngbyaceae cyanobacterium RU_5_1]|nr:DNA replication initiation control protein YabA [Leptolyngbyaceae cyanobacterium RU_5_1]
MTSNANARLNTQSPKVSNSSSTAKSSATNGHTHTASVPISLYREVATELQSTRTSLESLRTQNQELVQKNQQLRLEIERVVQTALHLRQLADAHPSGTLPNTLPGLEIFSSTAVPEAIAPTTAAQPPVSKPSKESLKPLAEPSKTLFTGQESQTRPTVQPGSTTEVGTWWLILVICLIVITAFGTGFLFVRPFLPSR